MDTSWATAFKDVVWATGMLAGGAWILYRFGLARDHTAHLAISTTAKTVSTKSTTHDTVYIAVRFENRGKTKLTARPVKHEDGQPVPAYTDNNDTMTHSAGLQLRRLPDIPPPGLLDWYSKVFDASLPESNLLSQFDSTEPGSVDFHLEPGEVVEVGLAAVLERGQYLARVHFLGPEWMDYWTYTFWVDTAAAVPGPPSTSVAGQSSNGR